MILQFKGIPRRTNYYLSSHLVAGRICQLIADRVKVREEFLQLARVYGLWAFAVWGGGALGWFLLFLLGLPGLKL